MPEYLNALKEATATLKLMPTSCATEQLSAEIDFTKYIGNVKIVINSTRGTDNDEVLTPTLYCGAVTGTYATLTATGATILGGTNEAATGKVVQIDVDASACLQFGKVKLTPTGTTPAHVACVTVIGIVRQGATL